jgi:hypothetical protein
MFLAKENQDHDSVSGPGKEKMRIFGYLSVKTEICEQ